jgi:hypothetical protein
LAQAEADGRGPPVSFWRRNKKGGVFQPEVGIEPGIIGFRQRNKPSGLAAVLDVDQARTLLKRPRDEARSQGQLAPEECRSGEEGRLRGSGKMRATRLVSEYQKVVVPN